MELNEDDKAAGEILRSLLSTPKIQNSEETDVNNWQVSSENNFDSHQQTVWQIESPKQNKKANNSNAQHIPVTYVTTDNKNIIMANGRPITYVLTRKMIADASKTCSEAISKPQKMVLVQGSKDNFNEEETKMFAFPEELQTVIAVDNCNLDEKTLKSKPEKILTKKNEKGASLPNKIIPKRKWEDKKKKTAVKVEVEKKTSGNRQCLKKQKNSKSKCAIKTDEKCFVTDLNKTDNDEFDEKSGEKKEKRNLFELTKLEDSVEQVIERFKIGCECSDTNCFDGLNPEKVFKHRLNIADLTKEEHDMYLMGVIMASIQNLDETCRRKERVRIRSCYAYQGKKVCLTAFLYLQHVNLYQMKRLRSHLKHHGVSPRVHGNSGRKPPNTFSLDTYRGATNFFQDYIEKHCVKTIPNVTVVSSDKSGSDSMSGDTTPSRKQNKPKVTGKTTSYHLPPECTKKIVHKEYKSYCESLKPNQKVMKYSTFTSFLKKQFPNVKFQKVDKKQDEKGRINSENRRVKEESSGDKSVQTVVYIPTGGVQVTEPATFVVAPLGSPQNQAQIMLNGQQLQFCGGNELQLPNQVLVGSQMYSAQCLSQTPGNAQQIYAVNNIV